MSLLTDEPAFGYSRSSISDAKLSTKKKPHISVTVVSSGLETRAGSSFRRFRTRGTRPSVFSEPMLPM